MARSTRRVSRLASRAGLAPEFALDLLREGGIRVNRLDDHVSPSQFHLAEAVLDLVQLRPHSATTPPVVTTMPPPPTAAAHPEPQLRSLRKVREQVPMVGRRQPLGYLSAEEVERIHWSLVRDFAKGRDPIEPPGVKSQDMLHSACIRPQTSLGLDLKYPTAPMGSAALLHSLIHNHPFHNGNKRTGLVSMLVFLDKNKWRLHADEDGLYDFVLVVGGHEVDGAKGKRGQDLSDTEVVEMARWIHHRIRPILGRAPSMKCHHLRSILLKYGCELDAGGKGNRINIRRGNLRTQVWWGGEGRDVRPGMIPKIREDLELDELHGVDDDMFYDAEERLPEFVANYRKTLNRLAKV